MIERLRVFVFGAYLTTMFLAGVVTILVCYGKVRPEVFRFLMNIGWLLIVVGGGLVAIKIYYGE